MRVMAVLVLALLCSCSVQRLVDATETAVRTGREVGEKVNLIGELVRDVIGSVKEQTTKVVASVEEKMAAIKARVEEADTDKDGTLSWDEILAALGVLTGGGALVGMKAQAAKNSRKRGEQWQAIDELKRQSEVLASS